MRALRGGGGRALIRSSRQGWAGGIRRVAARVVAVERAEIASVLWSFAYFFSVLCAYYILRPLRDEMGVALGPQGLKWLFVLVLLVMLAAVPLFGWVVSSFPRRRIVPVVYGFFIANLAIFWAAFQARLHGTLAAAAFFVWVSVFNLFVVSLFWSLMADLWRSEQARRLYGFIAAGGSLGALCGPLLTQGLVRLVGPDNLLLVSALFLAVAIAATLVLRRLFAGVAAGGGGGGEPVGRRGLLEGAAAVWRSPYLFRIALWIMLGNFVGTLFYLEQARIVGQTLADRTARVELFARVDLAVSVMTILAQVLVTARVMRRFGVGVSAAALPAWAAVGLLALAVSPTLAVVVGVLAVERTVAFALANPAVKVLYTLVQPEEKYKAQNFNDTVVFRAGDAASAWALNAMRVAGMGLGASVAVALPAAAAWLGLSLALGRQHAARALAPGARGSDPAGAR
jgi:AAA family ATP:ADP antiporter